jgi:hypothetical protein
MYGTFMVIIDIVTGFINAAHLCSLATKKLGVEKKYSKWSSGKHVEKLMSMLAQALDIDALTNYVAIKKYRLIRGTYIHPAFIPSITSWLLPELAVALAPIFEAWASKGSNRAKYNRAMRDTTSIKCKRITEADVQADLALLINADREVACFAGKIDLLTDKVLIEVKCDHNWIKAIGQLIVYSDDYPKHQKILYLYDLGDRCPRESILRVCASNNILVATNHEQLLGYVNDIENKQTKKNAEPSRRETRAMSNRASTRSI